MSDAPAYRVLARIKNNRLWTAIFRQWPDCPSQREAARRLGIDSTKLGGYLSITHWPGCWPCARMRGLVRGAKPGRPRLRPRDRRPMVPLTAGCRHQRGYLAGRRATPCDGWAPTARRIATALQETPEYLFDYELYGIRAQPIVLELDRPALEATGILALPEAQPDEHVAENERRATLEQVLDTLTPREREVLRQRWGFADGQERTLDEVGEQFSVTRERVRQVEVRALRKLRHPSRSRRLRAVYEPA